MPLAGWVAAAAFQVGSQPFADGSRRSRNDGTDWIFRCHPTTCNRAPRDSPIRVHLPSCTGNCIGGLRRPKPAKSRACIVVEDQHEGAPRDTNARVATDAEGGATPSRAARRVLRIEAIVEKPNVALQRRSKWLASDRGAFSPVWERRCQVSCPLTCPVSISSFGKRCCGHARSIL